MSKQMIPCVPVHENNPAIVKDYALCSACSNCLDICYENTGIARRFIEKGQRGSFDCVGCGQCTTVCPEGALTGKPQYESVREAVRNAEKIVIFSLAPSVRVGLGDAFYSTPGQFVEGKAVDALRKLGADYVLDVTFSADLTILEEGTEFLKRFVSGKELPQFTSCCPAWVSFMERFHPEMLGHLSSAKSPISMQGATVKTYFAFKMGIDPERIVHVAVAPCTAKKMEVAREELCDAGKCLNVVGMRDNDYVITTQELAEWIEEERIDFKQLDENAGFDSILGKGSGGGVIFGNTGGVMEAALRMAYSSLTGKEAPEVLLNYEPVRGLKEWKEAEISVAGYTIKTAVIYGLEAAELLIQSGMFRRYHFIEVMTCPGGCISGAGQPIGNVMPVDEERRKARIDSLYQADQKMKIRNPLDNPEIQTVYEEFYGNPSSVRAKELLHTTYHSRK